MNDNTRTTSVDTYTHTGETEYKSDIVYVTDLVRNYEHTLIRKDEKIKELEIKNMELEAKLQIARDNMWEAMYVLKGDTKKTKVELVADMKKCFMHLEYCRNKMEDKQ